MPLLNSQLLKVHALQMQGKVVEQSTWFKSELKAFPIQEIFIYIVIISISLQNYHQQTAAGFEAKDTVAC